MSMTRASSSSPGTPASTVSGVAPGGPPRVRAHAHGIAAHLAGARTRGHPGCRWMRRRRSPAAQSQSPPPLETRELVLELPSLGIVARNRPRQAQPGQRACREGRARTEERSSAMRVDSSDSVAVGRCRHCRVLSCRRPRRQAASILKRFKTDCQPDVQFGPQDGRLHDRYRMRFGKWSLTLRRGPSYSHPKLNRFNHPLSEVDSARHSQTALASAPGCFTRR